MKKSLTKRWLLCCGRGLLLCAVLMADAVWKPPASGMTSPNPPVPNLIHLPIVQRNSDPSMPASVVLWAAPLLFASAPQAGHSIIFAGQNVLISAVTLDLGGDPLYYAPLELKVQINGRSATLAQQVNLTPQGNGTYTALWMPTVSGLYTLSATGFNTAGEYKWQATSVLQVEISPAEIAQLELSGSHYGPVQMLARDMFGNPVAGPEPSEFNCISSNPDITVGAVAPDPSLPGYGLQAPIQASAYFTSTISCSHLPSGAMDTMLVGYAPWRLEMHNKQHQQAQGYQVESFFDVFFEARIPTGLPGWHSLSGKLVYAKDSGMVYSGCQAASPAFNVVCNLDISDPTVDVLNFSAALTGPGGQVGETMPFSVTFKTPASVPDVVVSGFQVDNFQMLDSLGGVIGYPVLFNTTEWYWFNVSFKPLKTLVMHIYAVEGSATEAQINADVDVAENSMNQNAWTCSLGFFVDFVPIITWIPAGDWKKIDQDSDGLDRYDRNGDGDYADRGENDDLKNAKDLGYFDNNSGTENVYYVPGIRGGALGTTYAPNGQVAVNNAADYDNQTLFHEKVHEMDLRKDGDFDVKDSPNDPANAQGARNPGNAMNYDNMGPALTPAQGGELDP